MIRSRGIVDDFRAGRHRPGKSVLAMTDIILENIRVVVRK